jgi:hypothetical protein
MRSYIGRSCNAGFYRDITHLVFMYTFCVHTTNRLHIFEFSLLSILQGLATEINLYNILKSNGAPLRKSEPEMNVIRVKLIYTALQTQTDVNIRSAISNHSTLCTARHSDVPSATLLNPPRTVVTAGDYNVNRPTYH